MLYNRLTAVRDFRMFEDWRDEESDCPHIFGKHTVVYGPNGSGKSTLADIFRAIQATQAAESSIDPRLSGVRFELLHEGATSPRSADQEMPPTLVYNRAYAEENLGRVFTIAGHGVPLYVLGQRNVQIEEQIEATRKKLRDLQSGRDAREPELAARRKTKKRILDAVKKDVDELLVQYDSGRYNKTAFNVTKAEAFLRGQNPVAGDARQRLDPDGVQQERKKLALTVEGIEPDRRLTRPTETGDLARRLASLAESVVSSEPIPRLKDSPALGEWAREGLALHEVGDQCGFCDGRLTEDRRRALEAHFDESYRRLERELDQLEGDVTAFEQSVVEAKNGLSKTDGPSPQHVAQHETLLENYRAAAAAWTQAARDFISQRKDNPFAPLAWNPPPEPAVAVWDQLARLVAEHNRELGNLRQNVAAKRKDAERTLLRHVAAIHGEAYDSAQGQCVQAEEGIQEINGDIRGVESRLRDLERQRGGDIDGHKLATALSDDLFEYFGHGQLRVTFEETEDGSGLAFWRNDSRATDLSEGERSAIGLLYFLRSLDSKDWRPGLDRCCLVIDDPVSSFDQGAMLSAFSFLWSRTHGKQGLLCAQLIVLTHNFEFFRVWKQNLSTQGRNDKTDPKAWRRVSFLQFLVRTRRAGEAWNRQPILRSMSKGIDKWDSEYYYLFQQACASTHLDGEELLGLTGNAARRLIESFVRWKRPQTAPLLNGVQELGDSHGVPGEVTTRVVNSLNAASHRTDGDITRQTHSSTILDDIRAALRFIREIDEEHYDGMCQATDVTPELLDGVPA